MLWFFLAFLLTEHRAHAAVGLPIDLTSVSDLNNLVSPVVANGLVKTVGLVFDHRAYEPATPLGTHPGIDFGFEATLVKVPPDFAVATAAMGGGGSSSSIPFLPSVKLNIHKGLGEATDFGFSGLFLKGVTILGYELKYVVEKPEEGPTWAVRMSYTTATLSVKQGATMEVSSKTFTPQVLMSRHMEFADPYIGVGYQQSIGSLAVIIPIPDNEQKLSQSGSGGAFMSFLGVAFKPPNGGIKLTLEGGYNSGSAHTLGTKFSFNF